MKRNFPNCRVYTRPSLSIRAMCCLTHAPPPFSVFPGLSHSPLAFVAAKHAILSIPKSPILRVPNQILSQKSDPRFCVKPLKSLDFPLAHTITSQTWQYLQQHRRHKYILQKYWGDVARRGILSCAKMPGSSRSSILNSSLGYMEGLLYGKYKKMRGSSLGR